MPWGNKLPLAISALLLATVAVAAPSSQRQQELLYLLRQDCGSCHGMTLKGGLGPALLPENLAGKDQGFLVDSVLEGRKATAMPPWKGMLSREEVSWLIAQLQHGVPNDKHDQ